MNATTLSSVSVRCQFNTNISTLSIAQFADFCQMEVEAAKEILKAIFEAGLVTSAAKSWKSPYFIRNVAVYLSNQAYLNALAADPEAAAEKAIEEADAIEAAEHEADLLEGDLDLLMAELEAAGLAAEETDEPEVLLVSAEDLEVPTDIATTKVDARELVLSLEGRKATDKKAFRRAVRNLLSAHDLPWTIEKGVYWLADPTNIYSISLDGTDIKVTLEPTSNF